MGQGQLERLLYVPEMLPRFILSFLFEQYTNTGFTIRSNPVPTRLEICKHTDYKLPPDLIFSHHREEWILLLDLTQTHARTHPPSHTHTLSNTFIHTHILSNTFIHTHTHTHILSNTFIHTHTRFWAATSFTWHPQRTHWGCPWPGGRTGVTQSALGEQRPGHG